MSPSNLLEIAEPREGGHAPLPYHKGQLHTAFGSWPNGMRTKVTSLFCNDSVTCADIPYLLQEALYLGLDTLEEFYIVLICVDLVSKSSL